MKKTILIVACMLNVVWASAQFSGSGSGTSTDPYRIFNADQLTQLRNFLNQEGVYFKLQNDIDLTDWLADNYPGQGWQPVGSSAEPFKGILDGNNKTISGFSITRSSTDYVGLFGYVTGATIKDLTLKGNISGKAYVGSLIGYGTATVTNYTFEGNVTGTGSYTGGVGGNQTTASTNLTVKATVIGTSYTGGVYGCGAGITTATFTGQVTGSGSYVGGLEGSASGTFSSCTVNGPVKSTSSSAQYVGGLFGYSRTAIYANNCKHEGIVQGKSYTGGLVGCAGTNVTLNSSIHRNNITGSTNTGGAIGGSKCGAVNLTSCYVEGDITGETSVGGICGKLENPNASNIVGCNYWGDISGSTQLGGIIGSIISSNATTIDFNATTTAGYKKTNDEYSFIGTDCFYNTSTPSFGSYSNAIGKWHYVYSSYIATDISEWTTASHDVSTSKTEYTNAPYKVVNNIRTTSNSYSRNINITNCSVISKINGTSSYIGGILGQDINGDNAIYSLNKTKTVYYFPGNGTLTYTNSLSLNEYRYTYYTTNISESYFSGSLTGTDYIGGIAGSKQGGCINNCYASTSISGGKYLGGIAGYLTKESYDINENSMNANVSVCNSITGTSNVGRIYGYTNGNFSIAALGTNSENRSIASTQVVVNGVTQTISDDLQHGTAVGIGQLRLIANYVAWGWDFNNCWTIQETESFPYKTWQSAPPTFSDKLGSGATTISGKSIDGGTVHLATSSGRTYTANCSGSDWSVTVSALHAGETVTAYAATSNKEKSYFTTTTVGFLGSGTEDDPYQITSAEDLQGFNKGGYYKIMNDINLTAWINQYSSTKGWVPVGYDGDAVYIDGGNHKITGLWTNSTDTYTGLFSKLKNGYIKNLNVEVASGKKVKGGQYTGILIAYATNFGLSNCSIKGNAEGTNYVGGIVGYFTGSSSNPNLSDLTYEGTLSSSAASAKVGGIAGYTSSARMNQVLSTIQITSTGNNALVGGLVGDMYGLSASQCTADVNISASGTGNKVGGLFGTTRYSSSIATTISECYSTGTIQVTGSNSWTGGIVGSLATNSQLSDSYSTATITGTQYTAGLVGQASGGSKINRCYASGNLTGIYKGAGIVGYLYDTNTKTTNCVALNNILSYTDQSAWASRVIGGADEAAGVPDDSNLALATMQVSLNNIPVTKFDDPFEGISKSEAELKQAATYEAMGWDFSEIWSIDESTGYPYLKWTVSNTGAEAQDPVGRTRPVPVAQTTFNLNTTYYLYNVGRGMFVNKGEVWGTQAILSHQGMRYEVRHNDDMPEGYYYLYSEETGMDNKVLFRTNTDELLGEGVCATFVDKWAAANAYWTINPFNDNVTGRFVFKIPENTDGPHPYVATQAWGARWDHRGSTFNSEGLTNGIFFDVNIDYNPDYVTWQFISEDDYANYQSRLNTDAVETWNAAADLKEWSDIAKLRGENVASAEALYNNVSSSVSDLRAAIEELRPFIVSLRDALSRLQNAISQATTSGIDVTAAQAVLDSSTATIAEINAAIEALNAQMSSTTKGDANGDGAVNVTDYLAVANYILGTNTANFNETAADVNTDGTVNVSDYVGVANIVLYGNYQGPSANAIMALNAENTSTWLEMKQMEDGKVSILLHNAKSFSAFQMDIQLPDGVEIVEAYMAKASQSKHLGYAKLENGTWRLLYGTLENKTVTLSGDNLLTLQLVGNTANIGGNMTIDQIFLVDRNTATWQLSAVHGGLPTGITVLENASAIDGDCYDLTGRKVGNSLLKKGVYVVKGKKMLVK